jgi:hypothetical protein
MRRTTTTTKIVSGLAVLGALAASGTAFTASSGLPQAAKTVGYDTTSISGATASDVSYELSADGSKIAKVRITFDGDQTASHVEAGFNSDDLAPCDASAPEDYSANHTVITCTFGAQDTATATTFKVAVT